MELSFYTFEQKPKTYMELIKNGYVNVLCDVSVNTIFCGFIEKYVVCHQ